MAGPATPQMSANQAAAQAQQQNLSGHISEGGPRPKGYATSKTTWARKVGKTFYRRSGKNLSVAGPSALSPGPPDRIAP